MDNKQNDNLIVKLTCVFLDVVNKWQIIVIITFLSMIGYDVYKTLTFQPLYGHSMQVALVQDDNTYSQLEDARAYIKTLDYILNGDVAKNYAMEKMNVKQLDMSCSVTSQDNSNVAVITVTSPTKRESYFSLQYIVEWYQNNMDRYHFTYALNVLEKPTVNENTINSNQRLSNLKMGFIGGFGLIVFILALYYYINDTVKAADDIQRKIDSRLFAKIPREKKKKMFFFWQKNRKAILITSLKTSFYYRESIKKLRNRFEESAKKHHYQTLMITSSLENEGKSSIAANLALALVQNGYKVLLIDGDLRKPSLHKIFGLREQNCINRYLNSNCTWQSQIVKISKYQLSLLCAKKNIKESEALLSNEKLKILLDEAKKEYDFILIDSSPVYDLNEPLIINECVDASLVVVKQDVARVRLINECIASLNDVKNNVIGCIFNAKVTDLKKQKKIYGYQYGYGRYRRNERRD